MSKIFLGSVADNSVRLLEKYLSKYMPDAEIEPLKLAGIKFKIKNKAKLPDVALVILDEQLYSSCKGVADDVLSLPKVHQYTNHENFVKFLEEKFGVLDDLVPEFIPRATEIKENSGMETSKAEEPHVEEPQEVEEPHVEEPQEVEEPHAEEPQEVEEPQNADKLPEKVPNTSKEGGTDVKDIEIQELKDSLVAKDTVIRNLEAQIEESSNNDSSKQFIAKIKSLEEELRKAKVNLESNTNNTSLIKEVDDLNKQLEIERNKYIAIEETRTDLLKQIAVAEDNLSFVKGQLTTSQERGDSLQSKVVELEQKVQELQSEYDKKVSELSTLSEKNKALEDELSEVDAKVKELSSKITELSNDNAKLQEEINTLASIKSEFEELKVTYEALNEEKDALLSQVSQLDVFSDEKAKLQNEISDLLNQVDELQVALEEKRGIENDFTTLSAEKADLEQNVGNLSTENEKLRNELNTLNAMLEEKDTSIKELEQSAEVSSTKVKDLEDTITELKSLDDEKTSELEELQSKLDIISSSKDNEITALRGQLEHLDELQDSLNAKVSEVEQLQSQLSSVTSEKDAEIESLHSQLDTIKGTLSEKLSEISILRDKLDKQIKINEILSHQEGEISEVQSEINAKVSEINNSDNAEVERLTSEVTDLTLKLEELQSSNKSLVSDNEKLTLEVTKLRGSFDSDFESKLNNLKLSLATLQIENNDLKTKIQEYKDKENNNSNTSKAKAREQSLYEDLMKARGRSSNLEIELAEKEKEIAELNSSIFAKLGNIAAPKAMFNLSLNLKKATKNLHVFAGGSAESNKSVYQVIRKYCENTYKSVLILDLVTDSHIDIEFGVGRIRTPIDFLEGNAPLNQFVANTKFPNTTVVSTATNYLNSLYLLTLDWNTIINKLSIEADVVIINVGCIIDIVGKVLFNAFSEVMESHVIVKASPVNLRTALIALSGIQESTNCKVSCVNFESSSKSVYQKLANKFDTQILRDSDVLEL